METFAQKILKYHFSLKPDIVLPDHIEWLYPYDISSVRDAMRRFFTKYFSDYESRTVLLGINPGRFGAGITGLPFTDPIRMETECQLTNDFPKKQELSSVFVYEFINAIGGPDFFYRNFYITSICPLGFVKDGKNYNYYDSQHLTDAIMPMIVDNLQKHISFGVKTDVAFSMGQGKNFAFLQRINKEYQFFKKLVPLPHPRWVMQYRLRRKDEFVREYVDKLSNCLPGDLILD
ncbi:MAG: DUF4918 family protein [Saprospiraceae bacterium]|nr:DUF4918 family protein [Saprospiraceae bacterium]